MSNDTMTAKVFVNGAWEDINPIDIKKGMLFSMYKQNGEQYIATNGKTEWVADGDAYYNDKGVTTIQISLVENKE